MFLLLFVSVFSTSDIPVYVICFNRFTYVNGMVDQLRRFTKHIVLLDNNSTQPELLDFYMRMKFDPIVKVVYFSNYKYVPHNIIYNNLDHVPDIFALTDPDLQFRDDMPLDFLDQFAEMTEEYRIGKVGCALNISGKLLPLKNTRGFSIVEWESRFWETKVNSKAGYECYSAWIDTTMAVHNKKYFTFKQRYDAVRVAGVFTAEHIPWRKIAPDDDFYKNTKRPDAGSWIGEKNEFRIENYYLD